MLEDKKNGKMNGGMCSCGCMGYGRHWTFFLLRTLLTVLILMMVFWFGIMVGRLSGAATERRTMMMGNTGYYRIGVTNPGGPLIPVQGGTSTPTTNGVENY